VAYDYMAERNALLGRSPLSARDRVAAPEDAAAPEVTVPESGLSAVRDAIKRRQTLQTSQQAFLDNIARQLAERRTGPSNRERLFELSAALARPTTVRGFSGLLNNVMPVLQQQAKASRVGAEGRAEALTAMQLAQNKGALELADQEVDTEVKLAELMAKANKPGYSYQLDQSGNVREVPKTAYRPLTKADFDAIPIGSYYVVPSGEKAGRVIQKTGGGGY
jgi:hypothetical protein